MITNPPSKLGGPKRLIGFQEFVVLDEESRTKQYRAIAQLIAEAPAVNPDPATGAEAVLPSILPRSSLTIMRLRLRSAGDGSHPTGSRWRT
jgi:hypothetical protein